ncbi:hypothetical protein LARI1_G006868 [Lachnellula arida]|uniref:WW domain-containing protein n=1 Tax=Lachnellula arida TaxID=1316785 RepID=A0A8T9BD41_9HELO|nr:hypothetical protein LARI1_G006868 [Lachnellula arida]
MANYTGTSYDLGLLNGDIWRQWSDAIGMIYYQNLVTQETTYVLPTGYEDVAGDTWIRDPTKTWPQWNNQRTGRARLIDPTPPTTYLGDPFVMARSSALKRTPESEIPEHMYRRMMCGILQWIFTSNEGFSVFQETMSPEMHPDASVSRVLMRTGGSFYDFLLGETKVPGKSWETCADHLHTVCASCDNETKNVYGMLQIGFEVQFYKHENNQFEAMGDRMHLVNDVDDFIALTQHLKTHPMPVVDH